MSDALAYDFKDPLSFGAAKLQEIVFYFGMKPDSPDHVLLPEASLHVLQAHGVFFIEAAQALGGETFGTQVG